MPHRNLRRHRRRPPASRRLAAISYTPQAPRRARPRTTPVRSPTVWGCLGGILRNGVWTFIRSVATEFASAVGRNVGRVLGHAAWVYVAVHGAPWLPAVGQVIGGAVLYLMGR